MTAVVQLVSIIAVPVKAAHVHYVYHPSTCSMTLVNPVQTTVNFVMKKKVVRFAAMVTILTKTQIIAQHVLETVAPVLEVLRA
jgi:hypothetical protein